MSTNSLTTLHQFISRRYDLEELRLLCFDLGVEYENLGGRNTRNAKARELILHMGETGQFEGLLKALKRTRSLIFEETGLQLNAGTYDQLNSELEAYEESTRPLQERLLKNISSVQKVGFIVVAALVIVVGIVIVYILRPRPKTVTPPMKGDFNIAVAEFGQLNSNGVVSSSTESEDLSSQIYDTLNTATAGLADAGFDIELREPARIGLIEGADDLERAENAEQIAEAIGADLLIYGNLIFDNTGTTLEPEFYLSDKRLRTAEELSGQYMFGSPLTVPGNISDNPVASRDMSDLLAGRATALANFTVGLGFFLLDRFDEAADYFEAAEVEEGWQADDKKEVVYLLLGNTAAKRIDFSQANSYYKKAIDEANGDYARAQLGLAQLLFLEGRDGCQPGKVDVSALEAALEGYEEADDGLSPPLAEIPAKAASMRGRIYLCMSAALEGDQWEDAIEEYQFVIAAYGGQNERLKNWAADATAELGLINILRSEEGSTEANLRALEAYKEAIKLSNHVDRQAIFNIWLAQIYLNLGDCSQAGESLEEADGLYAAYLDNNPESPNQDFEAFRGTVFSNLEQGCRF